MEPSIDIRQLSSPSDFDQCIHLQNLIWGKSYGLIPKSMLQTARKIGGLALGAFEQEQLVGFLYSMPGFWPENPEPLQKKEHIHWSYRSAVSPDFQNKGIGKKLKAFQVNFCKQNGFKSLLWSFDPFETRNAHLNINKFDAIIKTFVPNMYEGSRSYRHRRAGTHRLVVELAFSDDKNNLKKELKMQWVDILSQQPNKGQFVQSLDNGPNQPSNIQAFNKGTFETTAITIPLSHKRLRTKTIEQLKNHMETSFTDLFDRGFQIIEFYKNFDKKMGAYILARSLKT